MIAARSEKLNSLCCPVQPSTFACARPLATMVDTPAGPSSVLTEEVAPAPVEPLPRSVPSAPTPRRERLPESCELDSRANYSAAKIL